jgi:hypothetical protein
MTTVPIQRGYRQTFTVTVLQTVVADMRMRITPVDRPAFSITTTAGSAGQVLALTSLTDSRGTHTVCTVTLPPAATRLLGEGAVNTVEMETLPLQEPLGTFMISGSVGLNDD